jgi:hypothetical protein
VAEHQPSGGDPEEAEIRAYAAQCADAAARLPEWEKRSLAAYLGSLASKSPSRPIKSSYNEKKKKPH